MPTLDELLGSLPVAIAAERKYAADALAAKDEELVAARAEITRLEQYVPKIVAKVSVTSVGPFHACVRAEIGGDDNPLRLRYVWEWSDGAYKVTPGQWSGNVFETGGTKSVTLTVYADEGRKSAPVTTQIELPNVARNVIRLKAGDKIPARIPANTALLLAPGATYDITDAPRPIDGGNVYIGRDGDGPKPIVKFKMRAFPVDKGVGITFNDLHIVGSNVQGEKFAELRAGGVSFVRCDIGPMTCFIEEIDPTPDVSFVDCTQVGPIKRYFAFIDGARWLMLGNTITESIGELPDRSSSKNTVDLLHAYNTVTTHDYPEGDSRQKGSIDMRVLRGGWFQDDRFGVGPMRVGEDASPGTNCERIVVRGCKSLDGQPLRVTSGIKDLVVVDNDATVELSAPDKFDGRMGIVNAYIRSDRPVKFHGDRNDERAFKGVTVEQR